MNRPRECSRWSYLANNRLIARTVSLFPKGLLLFLTAGLFISCDAVEWGGIEVGLEEPQESESNDSIVITPVTTEYTAPLKGRTFLYLGSRTADQGTLIPIVEILPNGFLAALNTERAERAKEFSESYFELGSQFTLFSDGSRIGTFTTTNTDLNRDYCEIRPEAKGIVRLTSGTEEVKSFLALAREFQNDPDSSDYRPIIHTRALRQASIDMIIDVISSLGATWPPSVLESRQALNFFTSESGQAPTIIATFTRNDSLRVGTPSPGMYSILLIGSNREGMGYQPSYVDYRPATPEGKAMGRYLDHLDLNKDGQSEIVLEMLGETSKWISVLGAKENSWNTIYSDSCTLYKPSQTETS